MAISNNSTGLRTGVCTSTTRPTAPYEGQHIYETDTDIEYVWNGSAWVVNYVSAASPAFTGTPTAPTATAGTNTTQLATTEFVTTAAANVTSGFRNVIINGGFDVWQRGTSAAFSNSASTSFLADRWSCYRNSASMANAVQSRVSAGLDGFQYALRMQRTAGTSDTNSMWMGTSLETSTTAKLANKPVVLSFYARAGANFSASGSAITAKLYSGTGAESNGMYVSFTGSTAVINSAPVLTTSWQRFTYYGTMPATSTQLFLEFVANPIGTASTNDYWDITGVQLEVGPQATPFEHRPYGTELALCQRYYYRAVAGTQYGVMAMAAAQTTTSIVAVVPVPVSFRVIPTSLETNNMLCTDGANNVTGTFAFFRTTRNTISVSLACTGAVQFRPYFLVEGLDGTGYIAASAEL